MGPSASVGIDIPKKINSIAKDQESKEEIPSRHVAIDWRRYLFFV